MFSKVTRKLTAELLMLYRTISNRLTAVESSIQSLQAQINTLDGRLQWHQDSEHSNADTGS